MHLNQRQTWNRESSKYACKSTDSMIPKTNLVESYKRSLALSSSSIASEMWIFLSWFASSIATLAMWSMLAPICPWRKENKFLWSSDFFTRMIWRANWQHVLVSALSKMISTSSVNNLSWNASKHQTWMWSSQRIVFRDSRHL